MVQQEFIEAEFRHYESWGSTQRPNPCGSVTRKSIVVVNIYDSDDEESTNRTDSSNTPEDSSPRSPDVAEITVIKMCTNNKPMQYSSHFSMSDNQASSNGLPFYDAPRNGTVEYSKENTSENLLDSHITPQERPLKSDFCIDSHGMGFDANFQNGHPIFQRPFAFDSSDFSPEVAKQYIIRLREASERAMNSRVYRDSTATPARCSSQQTFIYQNADSYGHTSEYNRNDIYPVDYSTKTRTFSVENSDVSNVHEEKSEIIDCDSDTEQVTVVEDIQMNTEVVGEEYFKNEVINEMNDCSQPMIGEVITDLVDYNAEEPPEDEAVECELEDLEARSPVEYDEVDIHVVNDSVGNVSSDAPLQPSSEAEAADGLNLEVTINSLDHPMQRRSKRISGGDKRKHKGSDGLSNRNHLSKKESRRSTSAHKRLEGKSPAEVPAEESGSATAAGSVSATAEAPGGAPPPEKRVRRGGVSTRARARHLLSVGSVWRRPTQADLGPRRSWPTAGMHERPVWPLAGAAAPPSPPHTPRAPSPDPADLSRHKDSATRLHWALAACFQVNKDAKEQKRHKMSSPSETNACSPWYSSRADERSVQEIYVESRLYRFLDNEIFSRSLSKNSRSLSKIRETVGAVRSNQRSSTNNYASNELCCPLFLSIRNYLEKDFEEKKSPVEQTANIPSKTNNVGPSDQHSSKLLEKYINIQEIHLNSVYNKKIFQPQSSTLDERKQEMLEKCRQYIDENIMNRNFPRGVNSNEVLNVGQKRKFDPHYLNKWTGSNNVICEVKRKSLKEFEEKRESVGKNLPPTSNDFYHAEKSSIDHDVILNGLCSILYPIAKDYCKINDITFKELASYVNTLTPNFLMEWVITDMESENERL